MGENERIKRLVTYYTELYQTTDPFELADRLGILYQIGNCKQEGHYMFLKNHRYIFLSNKLEDAELRLVMAHELGHAVLDRKTNCYFIRNKTLFLNSKIEKRANLFAAELLLPDSMMDEYASYTLEQISCFTRLDVNLIKIKILGMKNFKNETRMSSL